MSYQRYCVYENDTINTAMLAIQQTKSRCACVLSASQKVVGVISQGDIIRALFDGANQYSSIKDFVNNSFIYLNEVDMERAYKLIKSKNLTLIPVIDKDFILVSVITLTDLFDYLEGNYSIHGT